MKIGIVYPQTEIGQDVAIIRDYVQTAEGLGYSHILAYDHVLGANPDRQPRLRGPYTFEHPFHEVFVLFSYIAALTKQIELTTGILILPQRQTALVAKQAATLDVLSEGRFRMGVGIGWNWVEYEALNQDFHTRGRRVEEQIKLIRRLWAEPLVNYRGQWDTIPDVGLNPRPERGSIPIWFGGHAEAVLRRVAKMGDGWMPGYARAADAKPSVERIQAYLKEFGRGQEEIGLEPRLSYGRGDPEVWSSTIAEWQDLGATHLSINTMKIGLQSAAEHIEAIKKFAERIGLSRID